jgi:hypothetical protein
MFDALNSSTAPVPPTVRSRVPEDSVPPGPVSVSTKAA